MSLDGSASAVIVEADGGSRGNPGPAGYGAVVREAETGEVLAERNGYLGVATNNVAEYQGLIAGLEAAAELGARTVAVRMDSKLVVEQMAGRWQIKHAGLRPLAARAAELVRGFDAVGFSWIPRLQNSAADRLANQAMDAGSDQPSAGTTAGGLAPSAEPPLRLEFEEPAGTRREPAGTRPEPSARPENNNAAWIASDAAVTRCILLRHGVTEYSVQLRFAGRSDLDLTEQGIEQARLAAGRIAELGEVAAIYSSPLLRARHTAQLVGERLGLPVTVEDGLIETDYGSWDGYTLAEARLKWPDELARWLVDPAVAPPDGESFVHTARRMQQARNRILRAQAGKTVLLVSHVSPIKALVQLALNAPPESVLRMYLSAASLSVIDYYADGAVSLRSYNETGHLAGRAAG
ncbi:MAG TPA: bifunctional RNase H/acid phosphatase [Jatrophihabitans sp.]|nr:bifunctional RNase H/acid phosphatase [Jatrophihabitans sp.]